MPRSGSSLPERRARRAGSSVTSPPSQRLVTSLPCKESSCESVALEMEVAALPRFREEEDEDEDEDDLRRFLDVGDVERNECWGRSGGRSFKGAWPSTNRRTPHGGGVVASSSVGEEGEDCGGEGGGAQDPPPSTVEITSEEGGRSSSSSMSLRMGGGE